LAPPVEGGTGDVDAQALEALAGSGEDLAGDDDEEEECDAGFPGDHEVSDKDFYADALESS
jgi:hypothetical protein